jgi:hypothetical protein
LVGLYGPSNLEVLDDLPGRPRAHCYGTAPHAEWPVYVETSQAEWLLTLSPCGVAARNSRVPAIRVALLPRAARSKIDPSVFQPFEADAPLVDIKLILERGIYARRTVFDFGWRRQGCPRLGLAGEQGSPDHPAAVRAMQRRQDRPLADRDRLQRAHGGFDRSRADAWGAVYRVRSIIGSEFVRRIARPTTIGGRPSIVPIISGRAWITGVNQYMLDPDDPWPSGYRLADTWPRVREAI